ncbi:tau 95 subunit of transcription factor TFIIIC [Mortierella alpina]|nr:tau 95 subunit of transcription factor TFIIIC [Mortierella alpina]
MASQEPFELAPVEQVPDLKIFSIEFPGHIQNPEKVKEALGGEQAIINASGAPLDLRYRIKDPFSIPIQGETVSTGNFLLKATRRYRVKRRPDTKRSLPPYRAPTEDDVPYKDDEEPEIRFEMVGKIPKTTRFAGLADYQHIVDPKDELSKIKSDIMNIEYESLIALKLDNRTPVEDLTTLQLIPPPSISKSTIPHAFRYKAREGEPKGVSGRKAKVDSPEESPKAQSSSGPINIESGDSGDE